MKNVILKPTDDDRSRLSALLDFRPASQYTLERHAPRKAEGKGRSCKRMENVANPGSTLGEAVGALIEREVNRLLRPIAEENGCVFVSTGRPNPRTGHLTKLLLKDEAGNQYYIDSVIANEKMQPLVLIESRYAQSETQNLDMSNEICTAHHNLRCMFPKVRKSLVILVGNWSDSSKAIMRGATVCLFEVGFSKIVAALAKYGVDDAGQKWQSLSDAQWDAIAPALLKEIEPELYQTVQSALVSLLPRKRKSKAKEHAHAPA